MRILVLFAALATAAWGCTLGTTGGHGGGHSDGGTHSGGGGGHTDGGHSGGALTCDMFCQQAMATCDPAVMEAPLYPDKMTCLAECPHYAPGTAGDMMGNTLQCRMTYIHHGAEEARQKGDPLAAEPFCLEAAGMCV